MKQQGKKTIDLLRQFESRNVTFVEPAGSWPIVWERAKGMHVWDDAGREYLDFTAAFAVAATGHANPCLLYTSPSPRDQRGSRMPSSA